MDAVLQAHAIAEILGSLAFLPLVASIAWFAYQDLRDHHRATTTLVSVILGCFAAAVALRFLVPTWGMFHDNYHGWSYVNNWATRSWSLSEPMRWLGSRYPYRVSYGPGGASVEALLVALFGRGYRVVFVAGALVSSCTVLFVALLTDRLVGRRAAWVAGLLAAVWPMTSAWPAPRTLRTWPSSGPGRGCGSSPGWSARTRRSAWWPPWSASPWRCRPATRCSWSRSWPWPSPGGTARTSAGAR